MRAIESSDPSLTFASPGVSNAAESREFSDIRRASSAADRRFTLVARRLNLLQS